MFWDIGQIRSIGCDESPPPPTHPHSQVGVGKKFWELLKSKKKKELCRMKLYYG